MTREERFKMDMIDEFKQMCEIVEKGGRIIENKQRMLKALEQEPIITSTEDNAEMIYPQVDGITPTGIEFDIDIPKKIESYEKLLKHPVIKHIMDMDETQEQLDFVQPHKKIPVTLTVQKEKTCDGCLFQQYPRITVCQECSRYYLDNYVKE